MGQIARKKVCVFFCLTTWVNTTPSWSWSYGSWIYNYSWNQCLSPLMLWVRVSIRVRCTTLCDKVCQWLATDRWFSPDPSVSSTFKAYFIYAIFILCAIHGIQTRSIQNDTLENRIVALEKIVQKLEDNSDCHQFHQYH
jgi:hypothetical protein